MLLFARCFCCEKCVVQEVLYRFSRGMIPKVGKKRKQCTLIDFCSFILVGNIAPTSHLPLFTLNFVICSAIQYVQLQNPQDQGMIYHLPTWIIDINRWIYHAWTPWQHDMMLHDLSTPSGSYFKVDLVQCLCSTSDALGGIENAGVKGTWMMYISLAKCTHVPRFYRENGVK